MTRSYALWLAVGVVVGYMASVYIYQWTNGAVKPLGSSTS